ncbi:hypothetical protein ABEV74_16765 [Paenibacillus cisolokensis]|jgi:hypothetical protein|uniref:Uncharacterized protein n=1 Tax=Paenibacillus cisolokensis TaxID=1658519 RepID=A0ABQ4N7E5_9BACL|nr:MULTISPECIES: hypothetical protein [Paenibacillus]ALS27343.1 hypothetical protein IJ21_19420 [Paenibacillus sp. 32O-W]GIQ64127.1 hypothetical protein PACILC2_26950 [Paenibacillus cisolokensis]
MSPTLAAKVERLRSLEHYCYQIAHYLLGNDADAEHASIGALLELSGDPELLCCGEQDLRKLARTAAIRHACRLSAARSEAGKRTPVH